MEDRELASFPIRPEQRWCLTWNHSVAGFQVRDCFVFRPPHLLLASSHQPDFAAGLGHIVGRGVMRGDTPGGYHIESIDEVLPDNRLRLRIGSAAVDHRIEFADERIYLSRLAAHQAVDIRLLQHSDP